ncbi:MAG TPA: lamin tail domain-containing protein, partial [Myxococcota bacterium]|nr:lamin tail domain-containing protein [Myxococcota bacterium]
AALLPLGCDGDGGDDCTSHALTLCVDDTTYWVNSCGILEEEIAQCECGCAEGNRECQPDCCTPDCAGRECGSDGCTGSCGACTVAGEVCVVASGQCVACSPDCAGKECGLEATCGSSCGECTAPESCNALGVCECLPDCAGKECGGNGCGGSCGDCQAGESCDAAGQCQACTADCTGQECGDDGCGGSCGECTTAGEVCVLATGQCEPCTPECAELECGPDPHCGASCGDCQGCAGPDPALCLADGSCATPCCPDCTGRECGSDGCGGACGTCQENETCDAAGQCQPCSPACTGRVCGPDGCGGSCGDCTVEGESCNLSGQCAPADAIEHCADLTPPAAGTCEVTAGNSNLLFRGNILGPDRAYQGGELLVSAGGNILCVGCSCAAEPEAGGATVVTCAEGAISPGLINTHDHLTFTHNAPGSWGTERYEHRHDWRKGKNGHTKIPVSGMDNAAEQTWGELRQIMGGTTSMAGAGNAAGWVRNLDQGSQEGLGQGSIDSPTFPLGDSDGTQLDSGCAYPSIDDADVLTNDCYLAHVAEGINDYARNEFLCLSSSANSGRDLTAANSTFIHLIGLLAIDGQELADNSTALAWSPRSNVSLYGFTAPVTMYAQQGVLISLGTDWSASGSINLVRELRCVDQLNTNNYGGFFSDSQMWLMATANAASALAIDDAVGLLLPGRVADVAIYDGAGRANPWRAVIEAEPDDVVLVLRGGKPLYGDTPLMAALPNGQTGCEVLPQAVCGAQKTACVQRESGMSYSALAAANTASYGLFFCGTPTNEPSCTPFRTGEFDGLPEANDSDGDGIPNADDLCPLVFDAPRWVDNDQQPNADGDSVGDLCDPCPQDPDTEQCTPTDPNDRDRDGVPNAVDNCPQDPNPNQSDLDGDGTGDVCDACPNDFNEPGAACPASIYAIKTGAVPTGSQVMVEGVVTAVASPRFWIQVPEAEHDAGLGYTFSGLFVYVSASNPNGLTIPARGDRVAVSGTVKNFYGQLELDPVVSVSVLASGQSLPAPQPVLPADVGTGGAQAPAYEGVLVGVVDGEVTALNPPAGPGDADPTQEYILGGALKVNDYMYLSSPFPLVGDTYSVTGVLRYANNDYKLEPRDADDVIVGGTAPAKLVAFGPSPVYVEEGATGSTPALVVTLNRAPEAGSGGVAITLLSGDDTRLTVPAQVVVPEGTRTAAVPLTGVLGGAAPVVVTASLDPDSLQADVVVLDPARVPVPVAFDPDPLSLGVGGRLTASVQLDIPGRAGGSPVALAAGDPSLLSAPLEVIVPEGAFSATFELVALLAGSTTLTASSGGADLVAQVEITDRPLVGLILSEVLYDTSGEDSGLEWVEIYNGTNQAVDLAGYSLGAGGTDYTYSKLQLAGTIQPGGCFVVGGPTSSALNFNPVLDQAQDFNPDIQNSGTTADGVALFAVPAAQITAARVPIDAVIYGTTNVSNLLDESGLPGNVDVGDAGSARSIERDADGWQVQSAPSPNVCGPF